MKQTTLTLAAFLAAPCLPAAPLSGTHDVFLQTAEGDRIAIASVTFGETGYNVDINDDAFTDHFLSMRPFKCLEGPAKHWCHVPYPYEIRRVVSASDLTDLEYDFLFLWKGATDYGIDLWNGIYYRIEAEGDALVGTLHEIDMNVLAVPPEAGDLRPVKAYDIEESDPDSHWLPRLVIE